MVVLGWMGKGKGGKRRKNDRERAKIGGNRSCRQRLAELLTLGLALDRIACAEQDNDGSRRGRQEGRKKGQRKKTACGR